MLQMNRSGMVTMIMFIWAHLVGPEQLHGIQSLPAEHIINILMFEWNFQIISKETDRWPHVDERVAIVQPSVDHQDLNILFRTHHSSIISINQCNGLILSPCECSGCCPIQGHAHYPMASSNNTSRIYDDYSILKVFEIIIRKHIAVYLSVSSMPLTQNFTFNKLFDLTSQ